MDIQDPDARISLTPTPRSPAGVEHSVSSHIESLQGRLESFGDGGELPQIWPGGVRGLLVKWSIPTDSHDHQGL